MEKYLQNIDIYSEQVRDILEKPPRSILKIGTLGLFIFLLIGIAFSHLIRYPDTLSMQGELVVGQKPIEIVTKVNGIIDSLFVADKEIIKENEILLTIKSTLDISDINKFYTFAAAVERIEYIPNYLKITPNENINLGELTPLYTLIVQSFFEFQNYLKDASVFIKINALEAEINQISKLNESLNKQGEYYYQDLVLTEKDLNRNRSLEKEGVIAPADREKVESKMLIEKRNFEAFKTNVLSNKVKIQQLKTQITVLTANRRNGINTRIFTNNQQIQNLKSKIKEWEDKYKISAPISGQVAFNQSINQNDFIIAVEPLITIIPTTIKSRNLIIQGLLPIRSSGTLKVGRKAIIQFINYPSNLFGTINGVVQDISLLPNEDNYRVKIELPFGLKTSYSKEIPILAQLKANVMINTKEYSLLERLFQNILDILINKNK